MKKNKILATGLGLIILVMFWTSSNLVGKIIAQNHLESEMLASAAGSPIPSLNAPQPNIPIVDVGKTAGEIGGINSEILNFLSKKSKKADGVDGNISNLANLQRLKEIVGRRKQLMVTLARENTIIFLSLALTRKMRESLPADIQRDIETETTVTGRLGAIHIDDFDHHEKSKFKYFLDSNNDRTQLYLSTEPKAAPGSTIKLNAYSIEGILAANSANMIQTAAAPSLDSVGDQKTLVLLVNFADSGPLPFTVAQAQNAVFNGQFQKFYKEQSYNKTSFSGQTYGWIQIPHNIDWSSYGCAQNMSIYNPDIEAYLISNGISLANYGRVIYLLNIGEGGCSVVGKSQGVIDGVNYNLSESWISVDSNYSQPSFWGNQPFPWTNLDYVLSHELGHGLGVMHANGWDCDTVSMGGANCQHVEYGNKFDTMGSGNSSLDFNAFYKELLGWISPSDALTITGSGNTLENASSSKKIGKIRMQGTTTAPFYVEYRKGVGFDSNLQSSLLSSNQNGLFVNYIVRGWNPFPRLLDMSPTSADWWSDTESVTLNNNTAPNYFTNLGTGITIGPVVSASSTAITFDVKVAAPQCIRGVPASSYPYGANTVAQGGSGYFGSAFTSGDSIACRSTLFNVVPHLPSSWSYIIYPTGSENTLVPPDGIGFKSLSYAIPATTTAGSYPISFDIVNKNSGQKTTVNWNVDVVSAPLLSNTIPIYGNPGTEVTIKGTGLSGIYPSMSFYGTLGYAQPPVTVIDSNTVKFTIPSIIDQYCFTKPCPPATTTNNGVYTINYYVNSATANSINFTVGTPAPVIPKYFFGGMYSTNIQNPLTTNVSGCPNNYSSQRVLGTANVDQGLFYCYGDPTTGAQKVADFGGLIGYGYDSVKKQPIFYSNPMNPYPGSGTASVCQEGYTTTKILGSSVDYELDMCYKPNTIDGQYDPKFRGIYGYYKDPLDGIVKSYKNAVTNTIGSCAEGDQNTIMFGTINGTSTVKDYSIHLCSEPLAFGLAGSPVSSEKHKRKK